MRRLLVTAIALAGVVTAVVTGCASMNKDEIESELLGLAKNAPVKALGLQRKSARVELAGVTIDAEYVYYHAGNSGPGRPTVVLVHGTPSSFATWTDVVFGGNGVDGLARDCDVWVFDMIGAGTTRTEARPCSFQKCAEWIGGFLDAFDLRGVTIAGNSYGGEMVWRAALDRPDRIAKVVLMSSSGFPRKDGEWLPEEVKMREMSLAKIGYWFNSRDRVLSALQPHFQSPVPKERLEEVYLVCCNGDNWKSMIDLARDEEGTRAPELAGMKQPALLMWGEKDIAYPIERFARLFEKTIPRASLAIVPGSGHYPQEESPTFVADRIREFAKAP